MASFVTFQACIVRLLPKKESKMRYTNVGYRQLVPVAVRPSRSKYYVAQVAHSCEPIIYSYLLSSAERVERCGD